MLLSSCGGYFASRRLRISRGDAPALAKLWVGDAGFVPFCEFYGLKWWESFVPTDSGYIQFCEHMCTRTMLSYCQKRRGYGTPCGALQDVHTITQNDLHTYGALEGTCLLYTSDAADDTPCVDL
eukprot:1615454-Pyramimonas_sp.AAC.1